MELLATLKAQDVEPDAPQLNYESFVPRKAVRVVLFDGNRVALLKVGKHGYYMLPGGGIDDDEDLSTALAREIHEELGSDIEVSGAVGSITIYNDRWQKKQTDSCYTARLVHHANDAAPTDFELEEGHELVWADDLNAAIQLVESAVPKNRDGKLVRARDLLFLKTVAKTDGR